MSYNFNTVVNGIMKYMDAEIFSGMNDLQELAARLVIGRLATNTNQLKETLVNNAWVRTFGLIDEHGMVDVDSLAQDLKKEIQRKEKITISIPMFGKITFTPSDVDVLYKHITGKEILTNEVN